MTQDPRNDQGTEKAEPTVSRRALIKAGSWIIPAVLVIGIPKNALAMTGSDAGGGTGGTGDGDSYDYHDTDWREALESFWRKLRYRWSSWWN